MELADSFWNRCFKTTELAMSKPVMLVCLLVILIVTSQFEWRQPLVDLDAPTTISQKQQQISDREESVKEKALVPAISMCLFSCRRK